MTEEQQQQIVDGLTGAQRHALAKAARVVACDRGLGQSAAVAQCIEHPEDVAALAGEFLNLANSLFPPVPPAADPAAEQAGES